MFLQLLGFELKYHVRQRSFLFGTAVFLLMGVALATGGSPGSANTNSPYAINHLMGIVSLGGIFVAVVLSLNAVLRDSQYNFEEILFATPVSKRHHLGARLAGIVLVGSVILTMFGIGLFAGSFLPTIPPENLGPRDATHYLRSLVTILLPNFLVSTALLFGIATTTRNRAATYVGGVALYVLYFVLLALTNSPLIAGSSSSSADGMAMAALLDPLGLSAFTEQTRYWTSLEMNTKVLSLTGHFLQNRLLWMGISVGLLLATYLRFDFRRPSTSRTQRRKAEAPSPLDDAPPILVTAPDSSQQLHRPGWSGIDALKPFWSTVRVNLSSIFETWPFAVLCLLWALILLMEMVQTVSNGNAGGPSYPITPLLIDVFGGNLLFFGFICILFYSSELIWQDRHYKICGLIDTTPTKNLTFFVAHLFTLAALLAILIIIAIGVALSLQLSSGYSELGLIAYAAQFVIFGLPLLYLSVLALFIQTLAPSRYIGMFVFVLAFLLWHRGTFGGLQHNLLLYANAPALTYGEMNGFGGSWTAFGLFMIYWGAIAGLLGHACSVFWARGSSGDSRFSFNSRAKFKTIRGSNAPSIVFAVIALSSGGFIFYNTNVLNNYQTRSEQLDWQADYEQQYKHLDNGSKLSLDAVTANINLFPQQGRFQVDGTIVFANKTRASVSSIPFGFDPGFTVTTLHLNSPGADNAQPDKRFNVYEVNLRAPLGPGEIVAVNYSGTYGFSGFQNEPRQDVTQQNGTLLLSNLWVPSVGYRAARELTNAAERRKRNLPPRESTRTTHIGDVSGELYTINLDLTISTTSDQTPLTSGQIVREWTDGDRKYIRFVSSEPIPPRIGIVTARFMKESFEVDSTVVALYHHPGHEYNIDQMKSAAELSLTSFAKSFGPYQFPELTMFEIPPNGRFSGVAFPGLIGLGENPGGFLADQRDPINMDMVLTRTAHEIAHQWWGFQLNAIDRPGSSVLIESFAQYSEMMILEAQYGRYYMPRYQIFEIDRYFRSRGSTSETEPSLSDSDGEAYLVYSKGAIVMAAVKDLVGQRLLDEVLERLIATHSYGQVPATIEIFLAELIRLAPEKRALLESWFNRVITYDLSIVDASTEQTPDGRFRITLEIETNRREIKTDGMEVPAALDEELEVGLFSEDPLNFQSNESVIELIRHRFKSGRTTLSLIVDKKPSHVSVDPYLLRLDENIFDNTRRIN